MFLALLICGVTFRRLFYPNLPSVASSRWCIAISCHPPSFATNILPRLTMPSPTLLLAGSCVYSYPLFLLVHFLAYCVQLLPHYQFIHSVILLFYEPQSCTEKSFTNQLAQACCSTESGRNLTTLPTLQERHSGIIKIHQRPLLAGWSAGLTSFRWPAHTFLHRPA